MKRFFVYVLIAACFSACSLFGAKEYLECARVPISNSELDGRLAQLKVPVYTSSEQQLARGAALFEQHCQRCHRSDPVSPIVRGVLESSRLTCESYLKRVTDEYLWLVIRDGGASVGLSETMLPWGDTLSDEERIDIIAFLRKG
jgi:mono/diheme cytochrome c family protein